jgi:pSer/pThr/pTyr-binding forkhead associated (FHA) protein
MDGQGAHPTEFKPRGVNERINPMVAQELNVNSLRRIDSACDHFEEAWRRDQQPRVEDYLEDCPSEARPKLLESLLKLQQELILKQYERRSTSSFQSPSASNPTSESHRSQPKPAPVTAEDNAPDKTMAWSPRVLLRVISGPHLGDEFVYEEHNTLLVGRSHQAQLQLTDDPHFSRNHFRLEVKPPTCYLMDLHSRNGTYVNGERVSERFLQDGDIISGGKTKLEVSISEPEGLVGAIRGDFVSSSPKPGPSVPIPNVPKVGSVSAKTKSLPVIKTVPSSQPTSVAIEVAGYQIYEQIGRGDLGTVYRATRLATGELCALKVMASAAATDEKSVQTFLREASVLAQLQHPHIVRMIEMGSSGSVLYFSTEYVDSISWDRLVARCSIDKKIRTACALVSQVLGALEYAHARSMVHRDVKPANILFVKTDAKVSARLADFGLAKQYTNAGMSQVTREGDVIGSLPFMSPEQFINSRDAKPACDIYSLGATLYWMLTGYEPILLENHPCKFLAILEDPPVPIQKYCPEIPVALSQVIHRALEKTPEKRFHSAGEMRQHLRAFLK